MGVFTTALSGLNAATTGLDVIGNNISNSGTIGFKSSRVNFSDIYATSNLGISKNTAGSGVQVEGITQQFGQGNLTFTSNNFDMAITGTGFFRLEDNGEVFYTRAGAFGMDRNGYIVNAIGQRLTGYMADANGVISGGLVPLQLDTSDSAPSATTSVAVGVNLDSTQTAPEATATFNPEDATTYNHSTSLTAYDSLGNPILVTTYYRKSDTLNEWNVYTYITDPQGNQTEVIPEGGVSGDPLILSFNADGTLDSVTPNNGVSTAQSAFEPVDPGTGADPLTFTLDLAGTTQYGAAFSVNNLEQDGYTTGRLSTVTTNEEGIMTARYTNGQTKYIAQVALADFTNPQGLQQLGSNTWAETYDSGPPVVGSPGTGTLGLIYAGALEESNVDLTEQLVNMITSQRNFQANAQVITTADTLTQTIINIR